LCEVALGDPNELPESDYDADKKMLQGLAQSTKGCGRTIPDPNQACVLDEGVVVPYGCATASGKSGSLLYNEYIVYDVSQIRMRYVVCMCRRRRGVLMMAFAATWSR
jgi:poly [ADP-ribose] polymerase